MREKKVSEPHKERRLVGQEDESGSEHSSIRAVELGDQDGKQTRHRRECERFIPSVLQAQIRNLQLCKMPRVFLSWGARVWLDVTLGKG
jgi:hypothetical protein